MTDFEALLDDWGPEPAYIIREKEAARSNALKTLKSLQRQIVEVDQNTRPLETKVGNAASLAKQVCALYAALRPDFNRVIDEAEKAQGLLHILSCALKANQKGRNFGPMDEGPDGFLCRILDDLHKAIKHYLEAVS